MRSGEPLHIEHGDLTGVLDDQVVREALAVLAEGERAHPVRVRSEQRSAVVRREFERGAQFSPGFESGLR